MRCTDGARLDRVDAHLGRYLLSLELVLEPLHDVPSLDLFDLQRRVGVDEILDVHVAATNTYFDSVALLDLDVDALLPELVDALGLTQEQDLDPISLWVLVDVVREHLIDLVHLVPDHDRLLLLHQVLDVYHQLVDFIARFLFVPLKFFRSSLFVLLKLIL